MDFPFQGGFPIPIQGVIWDNGATGVAAVAGTPLTSVMPGTITQPSLCRISSTSGTISVCGTGGAAGRGEQILNGQTREYRGTPESLSTIVVYGTGVETFETLFSQ